MTIREILNGDVFTNYDYDLEDFIEEMKEREKDFDLYIVKCDEENWIDFKNAYDDFHDERYVINYLFKAEEIAYDVASDLYEYLKDKNGVEIVDNRYTDINITVYHRRYYYNEDTGEYDYNYYYDTSYVKHLYEFDDE